MAQIKIEGLPQYDGAYDLDVTSFTGRELHTIKEISGVRAGELQEGFAAGDYDLIIALTVIVLRRAGKTVNPEEILDAAVGAITIDVDDVVEVEEERPPASAPTPNGNSSKSGVGENESEPTAASGSSSTDDGETPPSLLKAIGSLG